MILWAEKRDDIGQVSSTKAAIGIPHPWVRTVVLVPLLTSLGTFGLFRGQNQMDIVLFVRSMAYLGARGQSKSEATIC
jgi:hypothetical protein